MPPKKNSDAVPKASKTKQSNIRIADDLVHKLGIISQWRKKTISVICDPELRPFVEREFEMVVAEMNEATKKGK